MSDAVKAAGTQSRGGVTQKMSTLKLKRASLEGEPAHKRRQGELWPVEAAPEPPADSETDVSDAYGSHWYLNLSKITEALLRL